MKKLQQKDLRVDTTTTADANLQCSMRIMHLPTGLYVEGTGELQHRLRMRLEAQLEHKYLEYQIQQKKKEEE